MKKPELGIQLFTLRDCCKNTAEFNDTLRFIKDFNCDLIQISGVGSQEPIAAQSQKEILDELNMTVCVTHTPYKRIVEDIDAVIAEHKLIGCNCVGLGAPSEEYRGTLANVQRLLSELEPSLKKLKENGMTFNYHNHDFELELMDNGQTMLDYLISETDAEVFHFTPDVAWIHYAGSDPVEYLNKMKNRVDVCHFKDYTVKGEDELVFTTLGEGKVDLKACYDACVELNIPYIVYEQDRDWVDCDPKKATVLSWEFMKSLKK